MTDPYAAYPVRPGDVLLTRHGNWRTRAGRAGWLIRLGAWLAGEPADVDHVIVAWKIDAAGVYWGIQGQPGVVAEINIARWLADPHTVHNGALPKTADQRTAVCAVMEAMLTGRTSYDWEAIVIDALRVVSPIWKLRGGQWGDQPPAHIVCSSAADFAYDQVGLPNPVADRWCTPGDWRADDRQMWRDAA